MAAEKAGAAGPGVRRRGSAHRRDDKPAQTLKSGSAPAAWQEVTGEGPRPPPAPARLHAGPTPPTPRQEPQVPAGAASSMRSLSTQGQQGPGTAALCPKHVGSCSFPGARAQPGNTGLTCYLFLALCYLPIVTPSLGLLTCCCVQDQKLKIQGECTSPCPHGVYILLGKSK